MNLGAFLKELQRRHVYKVGAMYVVAGWLLVQVVTQVFPIFEISALVQRIIVLAIIAGLPITLVLAWIFDLTPRGIVRTAEHDASEGLPAASDIRRTLGRKLNLLLGSLLLLALGMLAFDHLHLGAEPVAEHSIAVLPLLNESGDAGNEYFSDGLSEELIAALAQISGLKVIGRNSSFRFKNSNQDSRGIGAQLGVGALLEGTVRRQGDRVRIVAALIHAADGHELWSQTYDRELKDIFAVQTEIAAAVAASLKLALLGAAAKPSSGAMTHSVAAHNAYLQGHFLIARLNKQDYQNAIAHFDEAIRLDPDYALAYAERSEAWTWMADWAPDDDRKVRNAALSDGRKAVELAPDLAESHAALGWVLFFTDWEFDEGLAELQHAVELAPDNATVNELLGRVLLYMSRIAQVVVTDIDPLTDPLSFKAHDNLARILFARGRLDEAAAEGRKSAELQPNASANHRWQVFAAVSRRDSDAALREARLEPAEGYRDFELALAQAGGRDPAAAKAAMDELIRFGRDGLGYQIAEIHAWNGEAEAAFEWLQHAYDQHDAGLLSLAIDPLMRSLRSDPRYTAMIARIGLPPAQ